MAFRLQYGVEIFFGLNDRPSLPHAKLSVAANMSPGEQRKRGLVGAELIRRHLSPFKMKRIVAHSRLATVLGTLLIAASILILGSQVRQEKKFLTLF